jgi:hypothetical protein
MLLPPEPGDQFSSVRLRVIEPRRRGVGSALLHAVFDQARQSGAGSVLAKVNANRPQPAAVMMAEGLRIATSESPPGIAINCRARAAESARVSFTGSDASREMN